MRRLVYEDSFERSDFGLDFAWLNENGKTPNMSCPVVS